MPIKLHLTNLTIPLLASIISFVHWNRWFNFTGKLIFLMLATQLLGPSNKPPGGFLTRIRVFTIGVEFDYISWTFNAVRGKLEQISMPVANYMDEPAQQVIVLDYLDLIRDIQTAERHLDDIYSDPNIDDVEAQAAPIRPQLEEHYLQRSRLGPLAESILQNQLALIVAEMGFTLGGQPLPPILYHSTPLPWALIVSPREVISQDANISLQTELTVEDHIALEADIDDALDVSSLVVPVGGIGSYPTMVAQTTNLVWLVEVVSHEWIHNYLTIRPLGFSYNASSEVRTMNETVASIAGKEIGLAVIARFYPEFLPPPPQPRSEESTPPPPPPPPTFDFRAEMNITRVTADQLLAAGKIVEAEDYMESRRQVFWEHGYRIRKLNQAYFAFHGAYADVAGGAAGEDPVGEAVRDLWDRSASLIKFVNRMSWLTTFDQLEALLTQPID